MSNDSNYGNSTSNYNYGWSFMLAVLGFLCSEISAVLCITAFLNRFESEVRKVNCNVRRTKLETVLRGPTMNVDFRHIAAEEYLLGSKFDTSFHLVLHFAQDKIYNEPSAFILSPWAHSCYHCYLIAKFCKFRKMNYFLFYFLCFFKITLSIRQKKFYIHMRLHVVASFFNRPIGQNL